MSIFKNWTDAAQKAFELRIFWVKPALIKALAGFDLFISRLKSWAPYNNTSAVTVSLSRAGSSEEASLSKHAQTKGDQVGKFSGLQPHAANWGQCRLCVRKKKTKHIFSPWTEESSCFLCLLWSINAPCLCSNSSINWVSCYNSVIKAPPRM